MIRFDGKIIIQDSDGVEILSITSDSAGNNISLKQNLLLELGENVIYPNKQPFILGGYSELGDGSCFSTGENFFMSTYDTNEYTPTFTITSNNPIKKIWFIFDTNNTGNYPESAIINDVTYPIGSYFQECSISSSSNTMTVKFVKGGTNHFRLEGILVSIEFNLDNRTLKSLDHTLMSASSSTEAIYGLISNSGSLTAIDADERIKSYIEKGLIIDDLPVTINLIDTLTGKTEKVLEYKASDWAYNSEDFTVTANISDELVKLQDYYINLAEIAANTSLYNILEQFLQGTPYQSAHIYENGADTALKSTIAGQEYVYSGTVWDMVNQLCEVMAIKAYINAENKLVFELLV